MKIFCIAENPEQVNLPDTVIVLAKPFTLQGRL
jgi:hypothetical protein